MVGFLSPACQHLHVKNYLGHISLQKLFKFSTTYSHSYVGATKKGEKNRKIKM